MLYRILLLLVLSCLGVARANAATTLWYERVPSQPSTSPGPRVFAAPGDSFAFVDNTLAHLSISVSGPSGNSARLEMRAPRGETFTTRAYEQTLPGFLDGNLATLAFGASSDPFCSDTGRFTILELTLDSEFQIASLAVDFEARCAADTIYGELRYQSSVPLTKDKPLDAQAPDAFAFIPRTLLRPGLTVTSNATTIYGIRAAAPVSIVGGQYSINGGPFTSAPGFASNRDRIVVNRMASLSYSATTSTTLTVGGVAAVFNASTFEPGVPFSAIVLDTPEGTIDGKTAHVETLGPEWTISAFHQGEDLFIAASGPQAVSELRFSAPFNGPIVPGPYEGAFRAIVSGASPGVDAACLEAPGRFVVHEIALNADSSVERFAASLEKDCPPPVGRVFGEVRFNSTVPLPSVLLFARTTPYPFALQAQSPVRPGALVRSTPTTIDGIDQGVGISIVGGEYSLNGGPFTSESGTVQPRDDLVVQLTASSTPGAVQAATVTAGDRSATLSATTYGPGMKVTGLFLRSTAGEPIGGGLTRLYLEPTNRLTAMNALANTASYQLEGTSGDNWSIFLAAPNGARLAPGSYADAQAVSFQANPFPALSFSGNGSACSSVAGRFEVFEATYSADGTLQSLAADFEHHCQTASSAPLFGEIRVNSEVPFSVLVANPCPGPAPCVADLATQQGISGSSVLGSEITFTVTVTNAGPDTAHSAVVTDTLPAGSTFVRASAACSQSNGTVTCNAGDLPNGASASFDITVRADTLGAMVNVANAAAIESDPTPTTNVSSAQLAIEAPPRAVNISTRGRVGVGSDVLIGGFIIGGSAPKTVVVTAIGPSLFGAGIPDALANPTLTLVRSSDGAVIAANDDWGTAANATQIQESGFAPADVRESAIMMTLPPGAYTAIVTGPGGLTGVGIVAVYEVDHPEVPLVNISTRGNVLTGGDVMIGGFVIQGTGPRTVVVTGIGPSLVGAGIPNALANPTLMLVRSSDQSVVAVNDDWGSAPNAADIQAAGFAPADASESAIMVTLPPGAYTAVLSGAGATTGVGIIAVYSVP